MLYKPFLIPHIQEDLIEVPSLDTYQDLVNMYKKEFHNIHGKTIADVALVWKQLVDWNSVERHDLVIPFQFAHQRKEPNGYRIWYLSQSKSSRYYHGNFFDLKVRSKKRTIKRLCKLSPTAIQFFTNHPEIKEYKGIRNGD